MEKSRSLRALDGSSLGIVPVLLSSSGHTAGKVAVVIFLPRISSVLCCLWFGEHPCVVCRICGLMTCV